MSAYGWNRLREWIDATDHSAILEDRSGATAIEYGMIIAVLSLVIIGGVGQIANSIGSLWNGLQQGLNKVK